MNQILVWRGISALIIPLSYCSAYAQPAGERTVPPLTGGQLGQTILGLVIVLAIILVLAWGVKRFTHLPGAGKGGVRVEAGISLGPRERVVLLSVEGTRVLVGVAPGCVRTLHVLAQADVQHGSPGDSGFDGALRRVSAERMSA